MSIFFIGIDISKDVLDFAVADSDNQIIELDQVSNNPKGIGKLISLINKLEIDSNVWVCAEHTGHYGLLLTTSMFENKIQFALVNSLEIIKSSGLTRGKTDPLDAKRIALYASTFKHKLKQYVFDNGILLKIKMLLTSRDQYVKIRTQLKNALKSLEIMAHSMDVKKEIKLRKKEIKQFDMRVSSLESQMNDLIKSKPELKQNFDKAQQVPGVGPITILRMLVITQNFKAFDNPRKFSCYSGLAPFKYESGSSIKRKSRTSKLCNKDMKKTLFQAACSAIQHDPQLKAYYKRKVEGGKHKLSVLNAVANKIVLRIFAVVKRKEPYVKFVH